MGFQMAKKDLKSFLETKNLDFNTKDISKTSLPLEEQEELE